MNNLAIDSFNIARATHWQPAMISMDRDDRIQADLIKAYRLLKRMMDYPKNESYVNFVRKQE